MNTVNKLPFRILVAVAKFVSDRQRAPMGILDKFANGIFGSALHLAALSGNLGAELLLEHGAKPESQAGAHAQDDPDALRRSPATRAASTRCCGASRWGSTSRPSRTPRGARRRRAQRSAGTSSWRRGAQLEIWIERVRARDARVRASRPRRRGAREEARRSWKPTPATWSAASATVRRSWRRGPCGCFLIHSMTAAAPLSSPTTSLSVPP